MKGTDESVKTAGYLALSLVTVMIPVVFWGLSFMSTKVVLNDIPPVSIAFFRQLIALVPLIVWTAATGALTAIPVRDLIKLAVSCFFGIVLYFIFENNGLRFTSSSNASMIVSSVPVFILLTEIIFFKTKATLKTALCILVSVTGVYMVISINGRPDFSSGLFWGNILMVGAMISWVIYTIISKSLGSRYSSVVITTWQTAISAILFVPFVIPEIREWRPVSTASLLNLLYLGIFCSAVSYFTFLYAIKRMGPTVSSAFLNLVPVVSIIGGVFIAHETLSLVQLAGMGLILVSLYGISVKKAGSS